MLTIVIDLIYVHSQKEQHLKNTTTKTLNKTNEPAQNVQMHPTNGAPAR